MILSYFANGQPKAYLPGLSQEERRIRSVFLNQQMEHYTFSGAITEDFTQHWSEFKDQVIMFHFGGHSRSDALSMEDHQADIQPLAALLGQAPHLKVVFLNGCANNTQVTYLWQQGIPAVVATDSNISDSQAADFAAYFYEALVKGKSLREAFEMAKIRLSKFNNLSFQKDLGIYHRCFEPFNEGPNQPAVFPWGLYVTEDQKAVLEWKVTRPFFLPYLEQSYEQFQQLRAIDVVAYLEYLDEQLQEQPHDGTLYLGKGLAYLQLCEFSEAQHCLHQATEYAPHQADAYYYLCLACIAPSELRYCSSSAVDQLEAWLFTAISLDLEQETGQAKYYYLWWLIKKQYYLANDLKVEPPYLDELTGLIIQLPYDFWEIRRLQDTLDIEDPEILALMQQHQYQAKAFS